MNSAFDFRKGAERGSLTSLRRDGLRMGRFVCIRCGSRGTSARPFYANRMTAHRLKELLGRHSALVS